MDTSQKDLKALFEKAQADLINAQAELSSLVANVAADPWLETQQEEQRGVLTARRDQALQSWSRIGLSWLMRGGRIQLVSSEGEKIDLETPPTTYIRRPAATPAAAPRPELRGGDRSNELRGDFRGGGGGDLRGGDLRGPTVVQTLRRSSRPEIIEYTPPPPRSSPFRRAAPVQELDPEALRDLLDVLTEPADMTTAEHVRNELDRLLQATTSQALMDWGAFPKAIQRSLVGHIVARARHVQDELPSGTFPSDLSHDLDRIFSGMTAFSKREQPGFVFGLMRHHHPVGESWHSDAKKWWQDLVNQLPEDIRPDPEGALEDLKALLEEDADDQEIIETALAALEDGLKPEDPRLVELMAPHSHLLRRHTQFKRLRKAIRAAGHPEGAEESEEE